MQAAPKHLAFLDGVRGYAAFYVLALHCMMWGGWWPWWRLPDPKVAVDVFMVMSGYLMVHHWTAKEDGAGFTRTAIKRFYLKRFFRIAPLYYLLLVLAFALAKPFGEGLGTLATVSRETLPIHFDAAQAITAFTPLSFLAHLTFLFGLIPRYSSATLMPDWSIGLEMQFYAAFPFLLLSFRRTGYLWICALSIPVYAVTQHLWFHVAGQPSLLALKLPVFLVGMLVAEANRLFKHDRAHGVSVFLIAAFVAVMGGDWPATTVGLACVLFLLVSLCDEPATAPLRGPLEWMLGNRLARFMADMSYSVYLTHVFFMSLVGGLFLYRTPAFLARSPRLRVAIFICITSFCAYGCGILLFRLIERPGIRFGNKLIRATPRDLALSNTQPQHSQPVS